MNFLNPAFLFGLAAVGIPVAIHLLNKIRVQQTEWAAMRFLLDSMRRNERKLKIEDLLLLILRCLFVALLVLAFARPVLESLLKGGVLGSGSGGLSVILLDNSASMGQSDGVQNRFDAGKQIVSRMLARAGSGSRFGFFLISDRTDAIVPKPSPDLNLMRRNLELATLSDRSTNLPRGIAAAFDALKAFPGEAGTIHVITDSQESGWRRLDEVKKLESEFPNVQIQPHILGESGEPNVAIVSMKPEGGVPAAGQPCRFQVEIANFGPQSVKNVRVTISVGSDAPSDESLISEIRPGSKEVANLYARFATPGYHTITATIPPDRLPIDNQRSSAVFVYDAMRVLVIPGNPGVANVDSDAYFIANALAPVSADRLTNYYMKLSVGNMADLSKPDLGAFDAVVLCNAQLPPAGAVASIQKYVNDGGCLLVFPGSLTDSKKWMADKEFASVLPAQMAEMLTAKPPIKLQSENYTHPIASVWNDKSQGNLGAVEFSNYFALTPKTEPSKAVSIANLASGAPMAVEWQYGTGNVTLFASSATPKWNNFPLHPGFVTLIQRTLGYINREQSSRLVLNPGDVFHIPVAMELLGKEFSVIRPGQDNSKRVAGRVELLDQKATIIFRETNVVGPYSLFIEKETSPVAVFAVQLAAEESDLRQIPKSEIDALVQPAREITGTSALLVQKEITHEFWTLLVWMVALIGLAEMGMAHWVSRVR